MREENEKEEGEVVLLWFSGQGCLLTQRPVFNSRLVNVGFVVEKVAMEQFFFSPQVVLP
jgi:hypothetical protein